MGEIGSQHIQAPLVATMILVAVSPSVWMNEMGPHHNIRELHALCPTGLWTLKGLWDRPTVYSSYPRRRESLAICGCNYNGRTFSTVKTLSVDPAGVKTTTSRMTTLKPTMATNISCTKVLGKAWGLEERCINYLSNRGRFRVSIASSKHEGELAEFETVM